MRLVAASVVVLLTVCAVSVSTAWSCSVYLAGSGAKMVMGKSYDWHSSQGAVINNKRGVAKAALVMPGHKPLSWTSRHGSVTFNQYGREMPNGGMNEAGLVVEVLWLNAATYPDADARLAINELQWIQWALDVHSSVAELAAAAPKVRVQPVYANVHYFACDATGDCAAFEYLGGKLEVTRKASMPAPALTNSTYRESATFLRRHKGFGGDKAHNDSNASLDRFVELAKGARSLSGDPSAAAFGLLDDVRVGNYTVWNIVYLPGTREIKWRTAASSGIKSVALSDFDFGCGTAVKVRNIDAPASGAASFVAYDPAANSGLVKAGAKGLKGVGAQLAKVVAAYPASTKCVAP